MGFLSSLFGAKKEKPKCPICGSEMGFFSKTEIADGAICDKCVARAAPLVGDTLLASLSIGAIKAALDEEAQKNDALVAAYGGMYPNLFRADYVLPISPKGSEVGIARAKTFKDSLAVKGTVISGEFSSGPVTVIRGDRTFPAVLLEAAPFEEGNNVEATLAAHLYKGAMPAGKQAWLIVDGAGGVTNGDLIGA